MAIYPESGNLYISGPIQSAISCDLFIMGPQQITTECNLFIYGHDTPSLYIFGYGNISDNTDLFIRGIVTLPPLSGIQPLDWLLKTSDYYPQIIGTFETTASGVNVQIWDIGEGQNTLVSIINSGCYAIGNTNRWGWSTINFPIMSGYAKHYFYHMISDVNETFNGQFILDIPENAKWIHPNDMSDYVLGTN